jgi:hypothetical protein
LLIGEFALLVVSVDTIEEEETVDRGDEWIKVFVGVGAWIEVGIKVAPSIKIKI